MVRRLQKSSSVEEATAGSSRLMIDHWELRNSDGEKGKTLVNHGYGNEDQYMTILESDDTQMWVL